MTGTAERRDAPEPFLGFSGLRTSCGSVSASVPDRPIEKRSARCVDPERVENTMQEEENTTAIETVGVESARTDRSSERGAGVVEWLGISALSIGMLVVLFTAMEALGLDVVNQIRGSLGL